MLLMMERNCSLDDSDHGDTAAPAAAAPADGDDAGGKFQGFHT
jgi:hypothetical protein